MNQGTPGRHEFDRIAALVAPRGRLIRTRSLGGGISAGMTALDIEEEGGRKRTVTVRRPGRARLEARPSAAEDEFRTLEVTRSLGLAVPVPYHLDSSRTILPTPYLVIEYVNGEMDFSPRDVNRYILRLADALVAIHKVDCSALSFLPMAGPCSEGGGRADATDTSPIRQVLAATRPPEGHSLALLHGDFWPGNTLWRDGELAAVIDWEDAEIGDPLADLGRARSEIAWIFGMDAVDAFTGHYLARAGIDPAPLPYWDLCAALRTIRLVCTDLRRIVRYFEGFGRSDITEETIRADFRRFVDRALEAVDDWA